MRSINQVILSGSVVAERKLANSRPTHFTLLHPFGGGKSPLFVQCTASPDISLVEHEDITVTGYLKGSKVPGQICTHVFKVKTNNK